MLEFLRNLIRPKYEPFNKIEIIKQNVLDNFAYLQSLQPKSEIIPVLKSNAYGHGLKEMCQILEKTNAKMVAVDSFPEAQIVYKFSKKNVLVLGEMPLEAYNYCDFGRTEFCVYNLNTLKHLAKLDKKAKIHLFLNTGMNREGIQNLGEFLENSEKELKKVKITGVCSHFASADDESKLNKKQEEEFLNNLKILEKANIKPIWVHLGNSAGIFVSSSSMFTAFRAGIALFGYNIFTPSHNAYSKMNKLKPALRLTSKIAAIQKIKKGESVSYNETWRTKKDTTIATVPFGYYEGLDRRLSNKAEFLVKGSNGDFYASVAGRVCMNLISLDCGDNKIEVGNVVEIISEDKKAKNSIQNLAKLSDTIPYEILVRLRGNIHREII